MAAIDDLLKRFNAFEKRVNSLLSADGKTIAPAAIPFAKPGTDDYNNIVDTISAEIAAKDGEPIPSRSAAPAAATDNLLSTATQQALATGVSRGQDVAQLVTIVSPGKYAFAYESTKPTGGGVVAKFLKGPGGADLSNYAPIQEGKNTVTFDVPQAGSFPFVVVNNDGAAQFSSAKLSRLD